MSEKEKECQNDKEVNITYVVKDDFKRVDLEYSIKKNSEKIVPKVKYKRLNSIFGGFHDYVYPSTSYEKEKIEYYDEYEKSFRFDTDTEAMKFIKETTKELEEKGFLISGKKCEYIETDLF